MAVKNGNQITLYLAVSFGITWACWIPSLIIARNNGWALPFTQNLTGLFRDGFADSRHLMVSILFSLAVYGPLLGAAVASVFSPSSKKLDTGTARLFPRTPLRWFLIVIALALLLAVVPWGIGMLISSFSGSDAGTNTAAVAISLFPLLLVWQLLTSGLGEEIGWRGFLLARLQESFSQEKVIWVLGLIWAIWHYPFTIFFTLENMVDVPPAAAAVTVATALAGQTISLIGMTYLYVWILNRTHSLFLAILFHALGNSIPAVLVSGSDAAASIIMAVMPWIAVFILEKALGKEQFPGTSA